MPRFIEIEKAVRHDPVNMHDLHSHSHYEIYYLTNGSRRILFSNALYNVDAPSLVVIPPYTMHKTEGGPFERFNIDVLPDYLNELQEEILQKKSMSILKPNQRQHDEFMSILNDMISVDKRQKNSEYEIEALFGYYVHLLNKLIEHKDSAITFEPEYLPALVMNIINYLNDNYDKHLTLDGIAESFFVSKATVIYNFNRYLHCSPIDFLLNLRLSKAKEELVNTDKNLSEIAESCGFSSANYFSLIFKRKVNTSPNNYRKYQRAKKI